MFEIYMFELRKIVGRKIVFISGGILIAGLIIWGIISALMIPVREYSDSSLNGYMANRAEHDAAMQISGRAIDQELIDEMRAGYEEYIFNGDYKKALPFLDVYNFMGNVLKTHASDTILKCDSSTFYSVLNDQMISSSSKGNNSIIISKPIIYQGYYDGWRIMSEMIKFLSCMEIMFISICLSTVFTSEHNVKTDQIIMSSRLGKKKLYTIKILAGLTLSILFTVVLSVLMFLVIAFLYGFDGYNTMIQFIMLRPFELTIGKSVFILLGLSFAGTILVSVFTMVLSEITRNSNAVIGITTGIMLVTMFITEMPSELKLLYELYSFLPSNLVSLDGALRYSVFSSNTGIYIIAPVIYAVITIVLWFSGKLTYNRYQISGR